jgi:gliotoxin/aspirochlorine biosynthesis gamma-glutamylcyclotransferase
MAVILTQPSPRDNVWYLAYGSNLASSKFTHDRGIVPLDSIVVTVPGYTLSMDSAGVPYREPSFANIRPISYGSSVKERFVIGRAYLLTPRQYVMVIASEGGGIAYREATVEAEFVGADGGRRKDSGGIPTMITARTFVSVLQRLPDPRPSKRYMDLITTGAAEGRLPPEYQRYLNKLPYYNAPTHGFRRIGAALFLMIWIPIMTLMERITKMTVDKDGDGSAPLAVVRMVRACVVAMWWWHDHIHAPIWGRGDGREDVDWGLKRAIALADVEEGSF